MNYETNETEAQTLVEVGDYIGATPKFVENGGVPYVAVPDGHKVNDLGKFMTQPVRKRGTVTAHDTRSFNNYVMRHGVDDLTVIYADMDAEQSKLKMVAVVNDYQDGDGAGWQDHRCVYTPKHAIEWKRWLSKDKAVMSQSDFVNWLEDNLGDIASVEGMPTGAQMLTMALQFEANSDQRLRSKINLQSGGVRFTLGVPVFDGSNSAYPIEARLKYRDKEGKVSFWYELIRPDLVFKTAATEEIGHIAASTGFLILNCTI